MNLRRSLLLVTLAAQAAYPAAWAVALAFDAAGGSNASAAGIIVLPIFAVYVLAVVLPLTVKGWRGSRVACAALSVLSLVLAGLFYAGSDTPEFQSEREADERFAAGMAIALALATGAAAVATVLRPPEVQRSTARHRGAR